MQMRARDAWRGSGLKGTEQTKVSEKTNISNECEEKDGRPVAVGLMPAGRGQE